MAPGDRAGIVATGIEAMRKPRSAARRTVVTTSPATPGTRRRWAAGRRRDSTPGVPRPTRVPGWTTSPVEQGVERPQRAEDLSARHRPAHGRQGTLGGAAPAPGRRPSSPANKPAAACSAQSSVAVSARSSPKVATRSTARTSAGVSATRPAITRPGMPRARARSSTAPTTLPSKLVASRRPSPVSTSVGGVEVAVEAGTRRRPRRIPGRGGPRARAGRRRTRPRRRSGDSRTSTPCSAR